MLFVQVFPGAWTAVLISLDNVGVWNIRTENQDAWYLGQETYVRVVNPEATNKTELAMPENALFCGALKKMQKYVPTFPFFLNTIIIHLSSTTCSELILYHFFQATRYIFSNINQRTTAHYSATDHICIDDVLIEGGN